MNYELQRLGADNFEHLVQSLVVGMAGIETIVFGDGPDGQREALIENASFEINESKTACGLTIIQAKYKSADGKQSDWEWLRNNLKSELDGFKRKKESHIELIPDTFLFFTNIVLTPVLDKGTRDKAELFIKGYKDLIPHIHIFGADDIRCMLDNNRDVARAYTSLITPGDVLFEVNEYFRELNNEKFSILIEYARQMFREDRAVRLEQAGGVSDKINLHNVYTDVEIKDINSIDESEVEFRGGAASGIVAIGNERHVANQADIHVRSRLKKEELNRNRIVLLGNAGQGKSTLCQYICQIYRAALLKRYCRNEIGVSLFSNNDNNIPKVQCERFPIQIILKNYAAWINKQDLESNCSIISYLIADIKKKTGSSMEYSQFRSLLSGYSWIFCFDGLDEVPASSNRAKVLQQINTFVNYDLVAEKCDSMVVCTSRFQGYDNAFSNDQYKHLMILDLSPELCLKYIDKLLLYIEDNSEKRDEYRMILKRSLEDTIISKLMTTPLYVAIVVLLVKMGGTPPTKRYALFSDYCDIVIKRELQKEMLPSLNGDIEWIKPIHSKIGFYLQLESEKAGNAAAEMNRERCIDMIRKLIDTVEEVDNPSLLAHSMYRAIVYRLPFLSETTDSEGKSCVVFPLRSIQEYFAAEWLITFNNDDNRVEALTIISVSEYWRNVFLFVAGYYSKFRHFKTMNDALFGICQHNNGNPNQIPDDAEESFIYKTVLQGSHLALDLINDNLFNTKLDQHRYLNLLGEAIENKAFYDIKRLKRLPSTFSRKLLENTIVPYLERTKIADEIAFIYLLECANEGNQYANNELERIIENLHYSNEYVIYRSMNGLGDQIRKKTASVLINWVLNNAFWVFSVDFTEKWLLLAERFYDKFQSGEQETSALRMIIYCFCTNSYLSAYHELRVNRIINNYAFLAELHSLFISQSREPFNVIGFHSITSKVQFYPLVSFREDYLKYGLLELVALVDFIDNPTYGNMVEVFKQLNDLPDAYKEPFERIIRRTNWLFEDIIIRYKHEKCINGILDDYKYQFDEVLKIDRLIVNYVRKKQIGQLILNNYIDKVTIRALNTIRGGTSEIGVTLDKYSEYVINKKCNPRLINTLYEVYYRNADLPFAIKNYCLCNIQVMLEDSEGIRLLLKTINESSIRDLLNCNWNYPNSLTTIRGFVNEQDDVCKGALSKINSLIRIDEKYVEAYSICGAIDIVMIGVDSYDAWDSSQAIKYLGYLKKKGNYLAIAGCIKKILLDGITEDMKQEITNEINWLFSINKNYIYNTSHMIEYTNYETKVFIYTVFKALYEKDSPWLLVLRSYLLNDLVSKPVGQRVLCKLSEESHDY